MPAIVTLDRNMTPRQVEKAKRGRPRNPRRIVGGWIADMVGLRKPLIFCPTCRPKFDSARHGYITRTQIPFVRGKCDGCQQFGNRQHFLFHKDALPR